MYSIGFMKSIKTRLIAQMFFFIIFPFAIMITFLFITADNERKSNQRELAENLYSQVTGTINERIELTQSAARIILSNGDLIRFMSQPYSARDDYEQYMTVIRRYITTIAATDYRSDIRIYTVNTSIPMGAGVFYSLYDVLTEPILSAFVESNTVSAWYIGQDFDEDSYNPYMLQTKDRFLYFEKMYTPSLDFIGVVAFSIPESSFFFGSDSYNENIITYKDTRLINMTSTLFEEYELEIICSEDTGHHNYRDTHVYNMTPDFFPLNLVILIPADTSYITQYFVIAGIVCFVLLSVFMFTRSINTLTRRMNECVNSMDISVSNGFNDRLIADDSDEIGQIAHRINLLLDKMQEQVKQTIIKETASKEAQLIALQHQINPHFIYNTLELFSSKMKLMGNYSESDSLVSFANIFRYNINTTDTMVTVEEEIAQVRNYMKIQNLFFPNISLETDIPEAVLSVKMPKFVFQPLIENSINHGTTEKTDRLTIWIKAKSQVDTGCVRFSVTDNGKGANDETIRQLNASLKSVPIDLIKTSSEQSIGLGNINNRLRLHYGDDAYITVCRENGQTVISFLIINRN